MSRESHQLEEDSTQRRRLNLSLNISQFVGALAFGLFIATRGLVAGTNFKKQAWIENSDIVSVSLFFADVFFSLISSCAIHKGDVKRNKQEITVFSLLSALFILINSICYLALSENNSFRKDGLPWFIMCGFIYSKLRDIHTINPAFGGNIVITNEHTEIDDESRLPKNAHGLLLTNQIFEILTICTLNHHD